MFTEAKMSSPFAFALAPLTKALLLALLAALAVSSPGCGNKPVQSAPPGGSAVPVQVATAVRKTVPVQLEAIGTVEALSSVSIKSQINGQVTQVHFFEGQEVKQGELLFSLDKRTVEAALHQAEAALARDEAQAAKSKADAARAQKLFNEGIIAQDALDSFTTASAAADAVVKADRAAIEYARVQLSYTSIYAPVSGRAGSLLVHPGDIVKANDVPVLVVINQIQPLYVTFTVPEQNLPAIKRAMLSSRLPVEAQITGDSAGPARGTLSFVDNAVDQSTGTIRLKGTFPNDDRRLWPGQFVSVTLRLAEQPNAIVVPSQAVQTSQAGSLVFVVRKDMSAESRPVTPGQTVGGETVIEKGIEAGEQVVTDGQLRLVPNAKVSIKGQS
jgi:multidrug efflux system membrane fusion protein